MYMSLSMYMSIMSMSVSTSVDEKQGYGFKATRVVGGVAQDKTERNT